MEDFIEIDENKKISLDFTAKSEKYYIEDNNERQIRMKFNIKLKENEENEKIDESINPQLEKLTKIRFH